MRAQPAPTARRARPGRPEQREPRVPPAVGAEGSDRHRRSYWSDGCSGHGRIAGTDRRNGAARRNRCIRRPGPGGAAGSIRRGRGAGPRRSAGRERKRRQGWAGREGRRSRRARAGRPDRSGRPAGPDGPSRSSEYYILFTSAQANNGLGLAVSGPGTPAAISYTVEIPIGDDGTNGRYSGWGTAYDDAVIGSAVPSTGATYVARVYGVVRTEATAGNRSPGSGARRAAQASRSRRTPGAPSPPPEP